MDDNGGGAGRISSRFRPRGRNRWLRCRRNQAVEAAPTWVVLRVPKFFPDDHVDELFELVALGMPLGRAAACVGVSHQSAGRWWRASCPVELQIQTRR
jgi:hypothetical protein